VVEAYTIQTANLSNMTCEAVPGCSRPPPCAADSRAASRDDTCRDAGRKYAA
jgi:hypothetical protein